MYTTTQEVRIDDLSYGIHLGYAQMVALLHHARVSFLSTLKQNEADCFGFQMMMLNLHVDYKAECFLGEKLIFEIKAEPVDKLRVCFTTTVSHEDKRLAAVASETMIFVDPERRKPVRIPPEFLAAIQNR